MLLFHASVVSWCVLYSVCSFAYLQWCVILRAFLCYLPYSVVDLLLFLVVGCFMHCIPVSCNSCCLVPSCALWSTFSCFYMLCSLPSGAMLLTTTCLPGGTLLLTVNYLMMLFHALFVAVSLMQQLLLSTILCSLVYPFLFLYALFIAFWCYTVNYYLLTCRYSAVKLDDVVSCLLSGALWFTFLLLYNIVVI